MRIVLASVVLALLVVFRFADMATAQDGPPTIEQYTTDGVFDETGYIAALQDYLASQAQVAGVALTPDAAASTPTTGSLPRTGNDIGYAIALAAGFLLVGGGLVVAARRGSADTSPAD
jgi:LPXTG-motif cell wall-anchored protein